MKKTTLVSNRSLGEDFRGICFMEGVQYGIREFNLQPRNSSAPSFETIIFDIYDLIATFLDPRDLASLCLVSRHFHHVFRSILWRKLRFRWPNTKRDRYPGERLLATDFDQYVVSLELDMPVRDNANCSWPISMNKHRRSKFLRRLKEKASLSSLILRQHSRPPRYLWCSAGPWRPDWAGNLLYGLQNLRRLTLAGPAFQDAAAVASVMRASSNLQILEIHHQSLANQYHVSDAKAAVMVEEARLFWAKLLSSLEASSSSSWSSSSSPSWLPSGRADMHRPETPLLKLHTLGVDEFAVADFASLTDLSCLRRLRLLSTRNSWGAACSNMIFSGQGWNLGQSAAKCFHGATGLASLEASSFSSEVMNLVRHLRLADPEADVLSELRTENIDNQLLKAVLAYPWHQFHVGPCTGAGFIGAEHVALPGVLVGIEHLSLCFNEREHKEEELMRTLAHCHGLRSVLVVMVRHDPRHDRPELPRPLDVRAAHMFKAHEMALSTLKSGDGEGLPPSPLRSRLGEITFIAASRGRPVGRMRTVFSKVWGRGYGGEGLDGEGKGRNRGFSETGPSVVSPEVMATVWNPEWRLVETKEPIRGADNFRC